MVSEKYGTNKPLDLSDWGRPIAQVFARFLKEKPVSVILVTNIHFALTLFCAWLIVQEHLVVAFSLLVVKGVIDAVDGELARMRERPSHVGRFWDTVADTIGLVALMFALANTLEWTLLLTVGMIFAILFQYSLFNHFSLRLRASGAGDTTSRMDERQCPEAHPWEKQRNVKMFHMIYLVCFYWQDRIVSALTGKGSKHLKMELTSSSSLGYGMQSILFLSLALFSRLDALPLLVLGVNNAVFVFAITFSRLGASRS
ncbi:MAG: CDP-alcohol phosphatidyltransferase family protein [Candidatus Poseidoniaceae archaeon]|nr:CDP-alcohol phosphatidyltransferase family protein [Candidatus Poseidoniaceae archaeon]